MHFRHPPLKDRPHWWPENEAWPPVKGRMRRNPFFRRLGCAFALFNFLGFGAFFTVVFWIASRLGVTGLSPNQIHWLFPVVLGVFVFAVVVIFLGLFGLRRVFNPLDELLEAAGRVAEGDYSVRVAEKGSAEVRSLAREFNNMSSRLDQADEKRRNLLADVTHELRTPLTVLQGNLEGMLDGIYPADETNLRALLDETNILARLIEDLRTVALAESGALRLKKEPTDLAMLARDTLAAFQTQADAAGVRLTLHGLSESRELSSLPSTATDPGSVILEADPGRMRQVLSNLVANALRYTPAGGSVRVNTGSLQERAVLEVSDDGPGIPADELPHIFERFYKSTDSGGMGLGLAIARHLVSAHGGTIEAQSPPGQGTTIRILLPRA